MPIRFRCAYCNQLLGIAQRKAGTVIRCPTCAGQVVVPHPQSGDADKPAEGFDQPLFENSDFEQMLKPPSAVQALSGSHVAVASASAAPAAPGPVTGAPVGAWGTHAEPPFDVEKLDPGRGARAGTQPLGILLSPAKATLLTVLVIVFMALAFGVGFVVGRAF